MTRAELDDEVRRNAARETVASALTEWSSERTNGLRSFAKIADLDDDKPDAETDWLELFVKSALQALLVNTTFGALDYVAGKVIGKLKGTEKMREMVEAPRPSRFYKTVLVPSAKDPGRTADNDAAVSAVKHVMSLIKQQVGARVQGEMGKVFRQGAKGNKNQKKTHMINFIQQHQSLINHTIMVQTTTIAHMTGVNADALEEYAAAVRQQTGSAAGGEIEICAREWALAVAHAVHGTEKDSRGKVTKLDKPKPDEWAPGTSWNVEKAGLLHIELDMGYSDGDPRLRPKNFDWKGVSTSGVNQGTLAQLIHLAHGHLGNVAMPKMITIRTGSDLDRGTIGLLVDEHGTIQAVHKNNVPGGIPIFDNPQVLWALIKASPIPEEFRLGHLVNTSIMERAGAAR